MPKKERKVEGEEVIRVPLPEGNQLFGVVEQALGAGWMLDARMERSGDVGSQESLEGEYGLGLVT